MLQIWRRAQESKWLWKRVAIILLALIALYHQFFYRSIVREKNSEMKAAALINNKKDKSQEMNDQEMITFQTNSDLVKEIQSQWLKPPPNLTHSAELDKGSDGTEGMIKNLHNYVLELLGKKRNGFFIESGAYDGVWLSNTLHLEREYNWTGLLVEPDPYYYERLMKKQRKAWCINACLSIEPRDTTVNMTHFAASKALTTMTDFIEDENELERLDATTFEAQCFPLTSILWSIRPKLNVDYFSLDVEGAELKILQTIPWSFVHFKVISVESDDLRIRKIITFLESKNFKYLTNFTGFFVRDYVFISNNSE